MEGADGDAVLVNSSNMEIDTVIAKGQILRKDGINLKKGMFEQ